MPDLGDCNWYGGDFLGVMKVWTTFLELEVLVDTNPCKFQLTVSGSSCLTLHLEVSLMRH